VSAPQNRIDVVAPTAPELAAFGPLTIGVRTITVTDRDRPDVLKTTEGGAVVRYDRALTLEVWYPAAASAQGSAGAEYRTTAIDTSIAVTLQGRAVRDAAPAPSGPFPLVVISHGYPGNRLLMSHLGENLASKGFVTVSIDHTDSTYADRQAFASTLYNRAPDQLFVVREMARLGAARSKSALAGVIDATRTTAPQRSQGRGRRPTGCWPSAPPHTTVIARHSTRASSPRSPSGPGACTAASGTQRGWPASARRCSSWPGAPTRCPATTRERARCSGAQSTPTATSSRS
jgi:hypothetical protein